MRIRYWTYGPILAAMCWPLDAYAAPAFFPDCAGVIEIAQARIVQVEQDGVLILSDGRAVMLEGIRLPLHDGAPAALRDHALATLRLLAGAGPVIFTVTKPRQDRYARLRAQGFGASWLQLALLEQGLARVQIAPDRDECAPDLYEAEARARDKGLGLWALPVFSVRRPDAMKSAAGFQLVEGVVSNIGRADGRTFLDFERNGRRVFSAVIGQQDRRAFRDFDFDAISGRRVRLRGMVQDYRGRPEIALSNPFQIEVLD